LDKRDVICVCLLYHTSSTSLQNTLCRGDIKTKSYYKNVLSV